MDRPAPKPAPLLTRVLEAGPPLELSDWALDPEALTLLLETIEARGCECLVECGSGVSTLAIARLLRAHGRGHLWSLEHDHGWAQAGRARLADEGLGEFATLIEAPLRPQPLTPPGCEWYDPEAVALLPAAGVDLLLVDGPPANSPERERCRYPALPVLAGRLAARAAVLLDDAGRAGEAWVLDRWEREQALDFDRRTERIALGTIGFEAASKNFEGGLTR